MGTISSIAARRRGLTLIEILVACAIMAIVAVIVAVAAHKLAFDEIESFGNQLAQATVDFAGRNIILDLSLVSFLSSIVIGKIFKARKNVLDSGGILSLVVTSQGVLDVFKICQLDRILPIHESLDDALEDTLP